MRTTSVVMALRHISMIAPVVIIQVYFAKDIFFTIEAYVYILTKLIHCLTIKFVI